MWFKITSISSTLISFGSACNEQNSYPTLGPFDFIPFFFYTKKGESKPTDYTTSGLNQLQFRGIWHAKLATDQTELTTSLGTKYTSH